MYTTNMTFKDTTHRGFTLIELLVVIAIMSILSSIALASLQGARLSAQATQIVQSFQQVERAFHLLALEENRTRWWPECDFGFGTPSNCNPDIADMVTDTNRLGKHLTSEPMTVRGAHMGYDNDNDIFVCGGNIVRGVNIHLRNIPMDVATKVSQIVDGNDDLLCGRIRWQPTTNVNAPGSLFYLLAADPSDPM